MNKLKSQKYLETQYITDSVACRSRVKLQQNETYNRYKLMNVDGSNNRAISYLQIKMH